MSMSLNNVFIKWSDIDLPIEFSQDWVAVDITWYTVIFTVKEKSDILEDDTWAVIKITNTVHEDPTHWRTIITISKTDTADLLWDYKYDIVLVDGDDKVSYAKSDILTFLDNVTKEIV